MTKYIETRLFILLKLNRIKRTPVFGRIYLWQEMFSKQFITIPHSKDLFFRVHSHAFNSFIFTLLCENRKRSQILSDAVAEITELWVENSQKINCSDVTSIREVRVNHLGKY